jgi:hypothetical protein
MRIYGVLDKLANKIVYVGKTINAEDYKPHGKHICKIVKNSPDRYEYVVLEQVCDANIINSREQFFIEKYNTFFDKKCFNFTKGGDGGNTICKLTPEQRHLAKQKEIMTKKMNPQIMQQAAKKAKQTFAKRPIEEQKLLHEQRIKKSIAAKQQKLNKMTEEDIRIRSAKNSERIKHIHQARSKEAKEIIANKISNTLKGDKITLVNVNSKEALSLCFSEWKKYYGVDVYHLTTCLQKTSHGWKIP